MARKDPLAHLAFHDGTLPDALAREIHRMGLAAVPRLVAMATDPAAWAGEERPATAARHALALLGPLDHPDAHAALLAALDGIAGDGTATLAACVMALGEAAPRMTEALLARAERRDNRGSAALEALVLGDIRGERIDALLIAELDRDFGQGLTLARYAENPCVVPVVTQRIEDTLTLAHPTRQQLSVAVELIEALIILGHADDALVERVKHAVNRMSPDEPDEDDDDEQW